MSAPLSDILAPDPMMPRLLHKYRVAFSALTAINCDARTLTDAQLRARLAVQTCLDLGDAGELSTNLTPVSSELVGVRPAWTDALMDLLRDCVVVDEHHVLDVTTDFFDRLPAIMAMKGPRE